jgi:ribosomal protein S5
MESAGVQDVLTKIVGSRNPFNVVRATFDAISNLMTKEQVRRLRDIDLVAAGDTETALEQAAGIAVETETGEAEAS